MSSHRSRYVLFAAALALCALRSVHIEADTPEVLTWSTGVYVDEGYKTLNARNLVEFGSLHWNPEDDYPGWALKSPLTHWAYYLAFVTLGPSLSSARLVTVLVFGALLLAFAVCMRGRYPPWLALLGLFLLGTQHTLFFFSRAALFEVPLILLIYAPLFVLARRERLAGAWTVVIFALLLCVATFGLKRSAPGYFLPVGLGLLVAWTAGGGGNPERRAAVLAGLLALLMAFSAWVAYGTELPAVVLPGRANHLRQLTAGTLMQSSAPLVALGLACAFHALLVDARRYLEHPYRASLLALILIGPLLILLFRYRPLRYFVPFMPAYALLAVEWLHLRSWERPVPARLRPATAVVLALILAWAGFAVGRSLHRYVLPLFSLSLPAATPAEWIAAVVLVAAVSIWWFGRSLFSGKSALAAVLALLLLSSGRDLLMVGQFLVAPSFRSREIAAALERLLPPGSSVAGDWAPFLTLGTPLRSLYSNPVINHPRRFRELQPDYYMWSREDSPVEKLARSGVHVRQPVFESAYLGRPVLVYPLR